MRIVVYLLIDKYGAVELRKKLPEPHVRQVVVRLAINLDNAWFDRPIPSVELTIPNDHVLPMVEVTTEPMEQPEVEV